MLQGKYGPQQQFGRRYQELKKVICLSVQKRYFVGKVYIHEQLTRVGIVFAKKHPPSVAP